MQFIGNRKTFYWISGILFLLSFVTFFFVPKNLGIDMTGGLQIEYSSTTPIDSETLASVKEDLLDNYKFADKKVFSDILLYTVNTDSIRADIGLVAEPDVVAANNRSSDVRAQVPEYFKKHGAEVTEISYISVGQSFGQFVLNRSYLTLTVCLIVIALYLMFAFRKSIEGSSSLTFGAITLVTLAHDVIIAPGIYILLSLIFPELKIDTFFVTAILTILGYSINDTIVILDRIRATYRDKRVSDTRSIRQIFDDSINVSLRRSLYTSLTLVIMLVVMLIFGPSALDGFVTLMLLGAIVGTYSSICIAAPLLYDINSRK